MSKVLVMVNDPNQRAAGYVLDFRGSAYFIPTDKVGYEEDTNNPPKFWEINEEHVSNFINALTKRHPGVEVVAYRPYISGIRPAGEITLKEISKDGVLPA
jgi:hypothetical protein